YGEAKVLNPNADDFPSVSIGQREAFAPIKSLGCFFEYSVLDLRRSELAGVGLDAKLAIAARQTIESKIDKLAVSGDERFAIKGLLNHEGINTYTLGKWFDDKGKGKSAEQMLADINQMISVIAENTNNVLLPDTLLLPVKHYSYLAQTPFSAHSQVTILNYILSNNPYIKNIDWWVHLKNQCVLYPRTPQALEMYIPLEFEMLEPQAVGMNIRVHCHARFGGVQVYTPKACGYGVGI
ncbi:MAG: major capsid family protein, partial [Minisyncoccia bacterium]